MSAPRCGKVSAKMATGSSTFHQRFDSARTPSAVAIPLKTWRPTLSKTRCAPKPFQQDLPILRSQSKCALLPLAKSGAIAGTSIKPRRRPLHRFCARDLTQRGRHYRDDEDCRTSAKPTSSGIVPHFTGPIATAALVNSLGTFSGPAHDGIQLPGPHPFLSATVPGL